LFDREKSLRLIDKNASMHEPREAENCFTTNSISAERAQGDRQEATIFSIELSWFPPRDLVSIPDFKFPLADRHVIS
jgi:hypothetical protein